MKTILITLIALCCAGCSGEKYASSAQFEAAIQSWELAGKSLGQAISILTSHEFDCSGRTCMREVNHFPCVQKQRVFLELNPSGRVIEAPVWKLPNGQLPTACL